MTTTNTTVTQGGLQPSGNYTIWVRAIDANGSPSLWSQAFPLSTVMDNVAPNPPAGNPTVDFTSSNLVVSWTASSPMPNDFQDYAITFTKTDNSANVVKYSTTNSYTLTYADNVAAFGGSGVPSLKVKIQARDKSGNISAYGNEVTATNLAPAAAPDGITATSLLNSYSVGNASTNTPSDLGYIEILQYSASSGGTATSKYKGLGFPVVISATGGSTVYITSRFVDAFGQQGPEPGTRTSIVVGAPLSSDTTPPDTPSTGPTVSAVADATDPSGSKSIATVSWTVAALSGNNADVAGYKLNITSGSTIDYTLDFPRNGITGGSSYIVKIPGLNSSATYNFKYAAYDEFSNVSGYSPSTSQLMPADSTPPGTPSTPTSNTKRNSTKILLEHAITDSGGTALAVDTAQLEVHIGTSSTFTASSANTSANTLLTKVDASRFVGNATTPMVWLLDYPDGTYVSVTAAVANGTTVTYTAPGHVFAVGNTAQISGVTGASTGNFSGTFPVTAVSGNTFTVTNNATGTATIGTTACAALARWMKIKAVDKVGNVSSTASTSYLIPLELVNSTFGSIIVGDANIGNLSAGKLTAGTAFVNDLNVFSILKVGDTSGTKPGYIQSFDYNAGTGPNTGAGWRIGHNGTNYVFDINNGSISAGALEIQTALNMLRMEHSAFGALTPTQEIIHSSATVGSDASFFTNSISYTGTIRLNNCTASIVTDYTSNPAGSYAMKLSVGAGSTAFAELASYEKIADGSVTRRGYLDLVTTESYIVSAWIKGDGSTGQSCNFNLSTSGGTGTDFTIDNTWKRYYKTITVASNATDYAVVIGVKSLTAAQVVQVRGVQVEKKIGLDSPSPYTMPGGTVINGSFIRTGAIASSNYSTGSTGWAIDLSGNSEFNNVTVRGNVSASSGYIGGTTTGWSIGSNLLSNNAVGIYAPTSSNRTNFIPNPSFEGDTLNATSANSWTATAGTGVLISNTQSLHGTQSIRLANTTSGIASTTISSTNNISINPSTTYTFSGYVYLAVANRSTTLTINWYDQSGTAVGTPATSTTSTISAATWTRLSINGTSPVNAVYAKVSVSIASVAASSAELNYFDAFLFEQSSTVLNYFDGSSYKSVWSGTTNNSSSVKYSEDARSNLIKNPQFEYDALAAAPTGYTANKITAAVDSTAYIYGSKSLKMTFIASAVTDDQYIITNDFYDVLPGQTYQFSNWVYVPSTNGTTSPAFKLQILTYNAAGVEQTATTTTSTAVTINKGIWTRLNHSISVPASPGYTKVKLKLISSVAQAASQISYTDGWMLEESLLLRDYFDGSINQGSWDGTAHNSVSKMYETAFYAGSSNRFNAPFMVKYDGSLFATNANVAGTVSGTLINAATLTITPKSSSDSLTFNLYNNSSEGKLGNSIVFNNSSIFSKYIIAPTGATVVEGTATNSRADGNKGSGTITLSGVTGPGFDTTMTIEVSGDGGTTWYSLGTTPILIGASTLSSGNQSITIPFPYSYSGWSVGDKYRGTKGGTGGSTTYSGLTNTTTPLFVGATDNVGTSSKFNVTTAGAITSSATGGNVYTKINTSSGVESTKSIPSGSSYVDITVPHGLGTSSIIPVANVACTTTNVMAAVSSIDSTNIVFRCVTNTAGNVGAATPITLYWMATKVTF